MQQILNLSQEAITNSNEQLNIVLADVHMLYMNTLNMHWNVKGKPFFAIHKLLEEQYEQIKGYVDDVAERIVTLGGKASSIGSKLEDKSDVEPMESDGDFTQMVKSMCYYYKNTITNLREAIGCISETKDYATEDLLIEILRALEKNIWMLASHLEK